jgi:hypothetical protein
MVTAINGAGLLVRAQPPSEGIIPLVHQRFSSKGNKAITWNIPDNGFTAVGMSGGAGGDCDVGVGCTTNNDCASNDCDTGAHQCR